MVAATSLSGLGAGLVFPFLVLYLAEARDLGAAVGGGVLAVAGATTLLASFAAGSLADCLGVRRVYLASRLMKAGTWALLAVVTTAPAALAAGVVFGLGDAASFATSQALVANAAGPKQRSELFAVRHAGVNLGFGAAAIVGGIVVDLDAPVTFVAVLLAAAAIEVMAGIVVAVAVPAAAAAPAERVRGAYRVLLRDRALLRVLAVEAVLLTVTAGQFDVVMPLAGVQLLGLETRFVGFLFAANTVVVVISSLVVSRLIEGRSRTRTLAASAALGAGGWLVLLAAGAAPRGVLLLFFLMGALQAIGESIQVPSGSGIVNDLAPDALRGRYNAAHGIAYSTSSTAGPAISGLAAGAGALRGLLAGLVVAGGVIALAALRLKDPVADHHRG
jgi:MFS family permease